MASSRHLRRPRLSSPSHSSRQHDVHVKSEANIADLNRDLEGEWSEPPLRAPAPSFEDYKGLERHGVLEHMAPLGTFPGQKVKTRLKHHEPTRRIAHLKIGEARGAREEVSTPEPAPSLGTRRSEPRKTEERLGKTQRALQTLPRSRQLQHQRHLSEPQPHVLVSDRQGYSK